MVVAEALSYGLPVICLDNDGPGEFICSESGISVPLGEYKQTTKLLGNALHTLYHDKPLYQKMSEGAIKRFEAIFDWNKRGEKLNDIYQSLQQKTL
ncbi:MAG: glycosyltransferase [Saprospiraceae bacterium]|nr:glycosyltransferase [Saprospiraceae bacterium]